MGWLEGMGKLCDQRHQSRSLSYLRPIHVKWLNLRWFRDALNNRTILNSLSTSIFAESNSYYSVYPEVSSYDELASFRYPSIWNHESCSSACSWEIINRLLIVSIEMITFCRWGSIENATQTRLRYCKCSQFYTWFMIYFSSIDSKGNSESSTGHLTRPVVVYFGT